MRWLLTALAAWLAIDVLLLWPFVGRTDAVAWGVWPLLAGGLVWGVGWTARAMSDRVGVRTIAVCAAVALALLLLGGEGRVFHANLDGRVRDAVLRDMAIHPWPYAYTARGLPEMLRAPLGMYLLPALAMKAGGQAVGDWALLAQNALLLTIVLALGATLFDGARRRATALAVFVAFSGLDVVGAWLATLQTGAPLADHLESWASPLQFSSHVTQIFWVPQHAIAGWIGAIGFALWRDRGLPLGPFLALVPLTVLWSPLGAIGVLPFAAVAGAIALARGQVRVVDIALPALACVLMIPTLLYLSADAAAVGAKAAPLSANVYLAFEALEAAPLLLIAFWAARRRKLGRATLAVIAAMLLLLPLGQVGFASDFVMRASIAPLALLALMVADAVATVRGGRLAIALAVLGLGAVTGAHEVRRAILFPRSPPPLCSFFSAWGPGPASQKSTYLAAVAPLPAPIRPDRVALVPPRDPERCWNGRWPVPTGA